MRWSSEQRDQLTQEYARIDNGAGEPWPYVTLPPATVLSVLQTVPDGAGCAGYVEALRRVPPVPWYKRWSWR